MKKINKKVIIIIIGILLVIPITTYAISNLITYVAVVNDSNNEREELLKERGKYSNVTTKTTNDYISNGDNELTNKIEQASQANEEKERKITNIINKFYPNEFAEIESEIKAKNINSDTHSVAANSPEMKLYTLILDIIEFEKLTEEESSLLKEFMNSQYSNAEGNLTIQERIEKLCM